MLLPIAMIAKDSLALFIGRAIFPVNVHSTMGNHFDDLVVLLLVLPLHQSVGNHDTSSLAESYDFRIISLPAVPFAILEVVLSVCPVFELVAACASLVLTGTMDANSLDLAHLENLEFYLVCCWDRLEDC